MKQFIKFIIILSVLFPMDLKAQNVVEIPPLFEYPVAPENLESLEDKCNYLVKNFWNNFNFKSKEPVDQYALNEAFQVYTTAFQFASSKEIELSVEKLIKNITGNKTLMLQFVKAAEESLYGPRADFWADGIYSKFLEAIVKDKKVPAARKQKYEAQLLALRESAVGQTAPEFWFTDSERASKKYFPMSTPTLMIFGNPDNTDWRLARIRMDTNLQLSDALKKGMVNIIYIVTQPTENWQKLTENYNTRWTVGESEEASKKYDVRMQPAIYLIGSDGKIIDKNMRLEDAINSLLQQTNQEK